VTVLLFLPPTAPLKVADEDLAATVDAEEETQLRLQLEIAAMEAVVADLEAEAARRL
jgi:hypothetical protein